MSTNYYLRKNICECCNRYNEIHIGKSSGGWNFALHVYPDENIKNLEDWERLFSSDQVLIRSEYDETIDTKEMLNIIKNREGRPGAVERLEKDHYDRRSGWPIDFEKGNRNLARSKMDGKHCIGHGETWDLIVGEFI